MSHTKTVGLKVTTRMYEVGFEKSCPLDTCFSLLLHQTTCINKLYEVLVGHDFLKANPGTWLPQQLYPCLIPLLLAPRPDRQSLFARQEGDEYLGCVRPRLY